MGDDGTTTFGQGTSASLDKGKGRAIDHEDVSMGEGEDSSSDESAIEDTVCISTIPPFPNFPFHLAIASAYASSGPVLQRHEYANSWFHTPLGWRR